MEPGCRLLADAARRHGVRDQRVLDAVAATRRDRYVPPAAVDEAWEDRPVELPQQQTTSQPSLIAAMVEALELSAGDQTLEVGSGYGYQTALMARLCRFVWGIELWGELAEAARANLASDGVDNAEVVVGDGHDGLPAHAPFQAIVVSATTAHVPEALIAQLDEGGRLVAPVGGLSAATVTRYRKRDGQLVDPDGLVPARFVELRQAQGLDR